MIVLKDHTKSSILKVKYGPTASLLTFNNENKNKHKTHKPRSDHGLAQKQFTALLRHVQCEL